MQRRCAWGMHAIRVRSRGPSCKPTPTPVDSGTLAGAVDCVPHSFAVSMNVIFVLAKMTENKVDLVLRNLGAAHDDVRSTHRGIFGNVVGKVVARIILRP